MSRICRSIMILLGILIVPISLHPNPSTSYERCIKVRDICQSYKERSRIFSGTLVKLEDNKSFFTYTFSVDALYKGRPANRLVCKSLKEGLCVRGPILKQGDRYLVFVHTLGNENFLFEDKYLKTKTLVESDYELKILTENKNRPHLDPKFCSSGK